MEALARGATGDGATGPSTTGARTPGPNGDAAPTDAAARDAASNRQRVGRYFAAHSCFACGQLNLGGLRLRLHAAGDRCWTEATLPRDFQGWEGITHGGVVSAILDEVMAWSLIGADRLGFTARLEVDFKRPVPVERAIRAEGWIVERRRRRFDTRAHITDVLSGEVLAEAQAIYLAAPREQEEALRERYDIRIVDEDAR